MFFWAFKLLLCVIAVSGLNVIHNLQHLFILDVLPFRHFVCNLTCDSYVAYLIFLLFCMFPFAAILYIGFVGNQDNLRKNCFAFFLRLSLLLWFLVFLSGEFLALCEACYFSSNTTKIAFVEI